MESRQARGKSGGKESVMVPLQLVFQVKMLRALTEGSAVNDLLVGETFGLKVLF